MKRVLFIISGLALLNSIEAHASAAGNPDHNKGGSGKKTTKFTFKTGQSSSGEKEAAESAGTAAAVSSHTALSLTSAAATASASSAATAPSAHTTDASTVGSLTRAQLSASLRTMLAQSTLNQRFTFASVPASMLTAATGAPADADDGLSLNTDAHAQLSDDPFSSLFAGLRGRRPNAGSFSMIIVMMAPQQPAYALGSPTPANYTARVCNDHLHFDPLISSDTLYTLDSGTPTGYKSRKNRAETGKHFFPLY